MKYRLTQIKTEIDVPMGSLPELIAKSLKIRQKDIREWEIRRKSVDSRKKPRIYYIYTADFVVDDNSPSAALLQQMIPSHSKPDIRTKSGTGNSSPAEAATTEQSSPAEADAESRIGTEADAENRIGDEADAENRTKASTAAKAESAIISANVAKAASESKAKAERKSKGDSKTKSKTNTKAKSKTHAAGTGPEKRLRLPAAAANLTVVDEDAEAAACRPPEFGKATIDRRPVVIGAGPAGLFAALELAKYGYRPIIIERGPAMEDRITAVDSFRKNHILDPEANMLFGEGGAGTFSDGKLGTGIKDGLIRQVLREFCEAGAGEDIMYLAKPHIGTDVLREVIVNIRKKIESLGGEFRFNTRLDRIVDEHGRISMLVLTGRHPDSGDLRQYHMPVDAVILASGHSARDTFRMLKQEHVNMTQKPFSIGVRMEHPQSLIDAAQYGEENKSRFAGDALTAGKTPGLLPPADYKLSCRASNGRGVYSFCMCPGGEVVCCSTNEGELCVNGMSNRRRNSGTANSGILCDVRPEDFASDDVLAGVEFQEKYERLAFRNGGSDYTPPQCSMKDFLGEDYYIRQERATKAADAPTSQAGSTPLETITPTRQAGIMPHDSSAPTPPFKEKQGQMQGADAVTASLPGFAAEAIREAVPLFARKIKGYDDPDAVITAVETRSSSPVRIVRDESGQSNIRGLYPAGEGAGYAGGITSAACDGIRAAWHIISRFSPIDSHTN